MTLEYFRSSISLHRTRIFKGSQLDNERAVSSIDALLIVLSWGFAILCDFRYAFGPECSSWL